MANKGFVLRIKSSYRSLRKALSTQEKNGHETCHRRANTYGQVIGRNVYDH